MRRLLTLTSALTSLPVLALAADIAADSRITAATVYPQGAQVIRTVTFDAEAGENRIIIDDLPLDFDAQSLRVEGSADAPLTIVSVDHRIDRLPPPPDQDNPERERIEGEIESLEARLRQNAHDIRGIEAEVDVAQMRLEFVETLMEREPQKMVDDVEYQRAGAETWAQAITVLANESRDALADKVEAERRIADKRRAADDLREELEKKLAELDANALPPPARSIATVEVASNSDVTGTLELSYRVWEAGWAPVYDLRLDQGTEATLQIDRHARVMQQTGEDWQDVALTLSTARPSQRMDAPDLTPIWAVLQDEILERRRAPASPSPLGARLSQSQSQLLEDRAESEMVEAYIAPEPVMAEQEFAGIETQGQTILYRLTSTADVAGDGTVRQLTIDGDSFEVDLLARATPEFDQTAYLYAALENGFQGPLLPGSASVYRDGTFIGDVAIPFVAPGDSATLPFGALDGITINRYVRQREDGDFGIIGTTNRRIERFEITAASVLSYAIPLTIYDRVPVSEEEDLEVRLIARPAASETDIDGKRGVLSWNFDLGPGAERKIEFGYDINWPGGQNMILNPFPRY